LFKTKFKQGNFLTSDENHEFGKYMLCHKNFCGVNDTAGICQEILNNLPKGQHHAKDVLKYNV
jgi:hypothetical protein